MVNGQAPSLRRERAAFAFTIFTSAFLLFQVQLVAGKSILPRFGGAPAVWTTCMLVYQVLLLAGYGYAAALVARAGAATQGRVHRMLLVATAAFVGARLATGRPFLPGASGAIPTGGHEVAQIVVALGLGIGLPFFLLSTTGPLLQSWVARLWPSASPYRLYALSSLGSLLGLLTYPTIVEPWVELQTQWRLWGLAYILFSAGAVYCSRPLASRVVPREPAPAAALKGGVSPSQRLLWFGLSACGSLLLLSGTNVICQDVAAVPLLWVLPLGAYLLTFILCFEGDRAYRRGVFHPLFAGAALLTYLALSSWGAGLDPATVVGIFLLAVFAGCMTCHGELGRLKPEPRHLTAFYLIVAAGGASGGLFTTLLAPRLFPAFWEFHLAVWSAAALLVAVLVADGASWLHAAVPWAPFAITVGVLLIPEWQVRTPLALLVPHAFRWPAWLMLALRAVAVHAAHLAVRYRRGAPKPFRWIPIYVTGVVLLLGGGLAREALASSSHLVARTRGFFGVLTVQEVWPTNPAEDAYELRHGQTTHGLQLRAAALHDRPTTYFHPESGIGLALLNHPRRQTPGASLHVGIVGLGVGTLAAYARASDSFRFYEINPDVIRFAWGEHGYFSFLHDAKGTVDVVPGDARLSLAAEAARGGARPFDVLAIDAFSGDAIPVHLLTREAFTLYLARLAAPDGILAVHTSNKSLDLTPVLGRIAADLGLHGVMIHAPGGPGGAWPSHWVLLSRDARVLEAPAFAAAAVPLASAPGTRLWTDEYSNVLSVLR